MEDLNQTQVVLLCLLTSFVTSIGTGIITVSLLNEAPPSVTQTINRVVERTVETIVPQPSEPNVITKEVTVVVKEEDLVIEAISKSRNSLVRIYKNQRDFSTPLTIGAIVKKDGTILVDSSNISSGTYVAVPFLGGEPYPVTVVQMSETSETAYLIPAKEVASRSYTVVSLGSSDSVQLGQTVIAVGGKDRESVAIGRIISKNEADAQVRGAGTSTPTATITSSIDTDTPLRDTIPGSVLLNLNGQMVGFERYDRRTGAETNYTAINVLKREFPGFLE